MLRPDIKSTTCPIRRIGTNDDHHFFGYYNKTTWDRTGRYLLANRVPMLTANLTPELSAEVGFFDLKYRDKFHRVGQTKAWNWQMGCQLQWLDSAPGKQLIYNTRSTDSSSVYPGFRSTIHNVETGQDRILPLPIYVLAPNSEYALCIDYRRLYVTHETIGYSEHGRPRALANAPTNDGIHRLDLATGEARLILSLEDLKRFNTVESMDKAIHWVSHVEINPSSSRFLFLHRWTERVEDETCFLHRLITAAPNGSDLRLLECSDHPLPQLAKDFDPSSVGTYDYEKSEYQVSHPTWRDDDHAMVWGPHGGSIHYHLYHDSDDRGVTAVGSDILTENGHMSYSPTNKQLLVSDTYPDPQTNERLLFLFDAEKGIRYDVGSFYTDPSLKKENRCDLHPRWSRDGNQVCIDSVHESERQMYIVDVSEITSPDA